MEIFKVGHLSFSYPSAESNALEDISFSVSSGEFVLLCGPSGCGKSTLLRHFKTVLTPVGSRSGSVLFCNKPLAESGEREQSSQIGFVGQSPDNQIVTDKVWHELAFGLESLGFDSDTIRRRTAEMASFFGIQNWFEKSVCELSGGQKQILNLASVMIMQPSVLILDEPASQLDPIAAAEFLSAVGKINRELGVTVIMTEHRLDEVFPLADRVLVMDGGRMISDTEPVEMSGALKNGADELQLSLPVPVRIWMNVDGNGKCPVTVSEGRSWLENYARNHTLRKLPEKSEPAIGEIVLEAENLWFRYEKESPDILKGTSVKAYKGELLGILGGNGAGKTTLLSALGGTVGCYRGKIRLFGQELLKVKNPYRGKLGVLPQNPLSLFVKKTVREDLLEMLADNTADEREQKRLSGVIKICRLEGLLERHPFDLSGGERQRAALAKILLTRPEILLLDEPTKGIDAAFKQTFADMLKKLCADGISVIMVSHDVEFCAEHCDRCAMLFNGEIVSDGSPTEFFAENSFYTTAASRMSRNLISGAVTANDVIYACGGEISEFHDDFCDIESYGKSEGNVYFQENKKTPLLKKITALLSLLVFLFSAAACSGKNAFSDLFSNFPQLKYILLGASASAFVILTGKRRKRERAVEPHSKPRLKKRTAAAVLMILLCIPITIYIGVFYLGDKKYLFISLLVMLECMLPFFMVFEERSPQARELVTVATLCAIAVAGRAAFYMLPQFKPVTAIVIISGAAFGGETGFLVGSLTMLVSNIFFQQGPWTPWQMFAMGIIGFLAGTLFKKVFFSESKAALSVFGLFSAVVIYGGIMNPAAAVMAHMPLNKETLAAYYAAGLPMDIVHGVATMLFLYVGAEPMLEKLERIKLKYGMGE